MDSDFGHFFYLFVEPKPFVLRLLVHLLQQNQLFFFKKKAFELSYFQFQFQLLVLKDLSEL